MEVDIATISVSIQNFLQNRLSTTTTIPAYESEILTFLTGSMKILYQTLTHKFQEDHCIENDIETTKLNLYNGRYIILKNSDTYTCLLYMEMKAAPKKLTLDEILPMPKKYRSGFFDFKLRTIRNSVSRSVSKSNIFKFLLNSIHISPLGTIVKLKSKIKYHASDISPYYKRHTMSRKEKSKKEQPISTIDEFETVFSANETIYSMNESNCSFTFDGYSSNDINSSSDGCLFSIEDGECSSENRTTNIFIQNDLSSVFNTEEVDDSQIEEFKSIVDGQSSVKLKKIRRISSKISVCNSDFSDDSETYF